MTGAALVEVKTGPGFLVRALWYVLIGWWLTGIVMAIAWLAGASVVGLPLTFYLANRIPTFLTLRPRRERYAAVLGSDGVTRYERVATRQSSLLLRILYFVVIGWWLSGIWMAVSWLLSVSIIGLPLGLMMVNRVPFIFSLHRGYA